MQQNNIPIFKDLQFNWKHDNTESRNISSVPRELGNVTEREKIVSTTGGFNRPLPLSIPQTAPNPSTSRNTKK